MPRADAAGSGPYEKIYAVVRRIPRGRVATYGEVAALAGLRGRARQVGYALHALRDEVLGRARAVAQATGGFLGMGSKISVEEEVVLGQLAKAFAD